MGRPVFPLGTAYLPYDEVVLRVFEDRYVTMLKDVQANDGMFTSVLISQGSEVGGGDKRFSYGVNVQLTSVALSDVGFMVHGVATQRIRVSSWLSDNPYPYAEIDTLTDDRLSQSEHHNAASSLSLLAQNVRTLREAIAELHAVSEEQVITDPMLATIAAGRWWETGVSAPEIDRAFWTVARHVPCGPLDRYELLQPSSPLERLARLRYIVEHVTEVVAFQRQK